MKMSKPILAVFIGPAIITYLIAFIYPIIRTTYMSFFDLEIVTDPMYMWTFVGIENFVILFTQSPLFIQSLYNILRLWIVGGLVVFTLALLFAAFLTSGVRFKSFFRAVIYLPNVVAAVAMGTMWIQYVFNARFGIINVFLGFFGHPGIQFTSPDLIFWAMLIAYCFGMVGWFLLVFMAAIDGIPYDYFEAALLEGAGFFARFFKITLPLILENIRNSIVLWSVAMVNFFVWPMVFSPFMPIVGTVSPVVYMYQMVFGGMIVAQVQRNVGVGAAIGVVLSVIVVTIFAVTSVLFRKAKVEF